MLFFCYFPSDSIIHCLALSRYLRQVQPKRHEARSWDESTTRQQPQPSPTIVPAITTLWRMLTKVKCVIVNYINVICNLIWLSSFLGVDMNLYTTFIGYVVPQKIHRYLLLIYNLMVDIKWLVLLKTNLCNFLLCTS